MYRNVLLATVIYVVSSVNCMAFEFSPPKRSESSYGNIKRASMTGTYKLGTDEVLERVQFTYNVGFCDMTSYTTSKTYTAAMGDPDLKSYKVDFFVRNTRSNIRRTYSSSVFTWGRW